MPSRRFAVRLVGQGGAFGLREELIGDLLEEIESGRSGLWLCRQLLGVYGCAVVAGIRARARLTPHLVALALCVVLLTAVSVSSGRVVLAAWLGFYYATGMLSLFAEMASHKMGTQTTVDVSEGRDATD